MHAVLNRGVEPAARKHVLSIAVGSRPAQGPAFAHGARIIVMHAIVPRFRPPAPTPLPRPLGPLALLKALRRNPIECWTKAHFEEPIVLRYSAQETAVFLYVRTVSTTRRSSRAAQQVAGCVSKAGCATEIDSWKKASLEEDPGQVRRSEYEDSD